MILKLIAHKIVTPAAAVCALLACCPRVEASHADGARAYYKHAFGVCAGAPQTIAFTYERTLRSNLSARVHVGSAILLSSAGMRLQWQYDRGAFQPYLFAGATVIHSVAEDFGDPEGATGYLWLGPGANIGSGRWVLFIEVCALLGGDDDRGLGDDWVFPFSPAIAAGVLIRG